MAMRRQAARERSEAISLRSLRPGTGADGRWLAVLNGWSPVTVVLTAAATLVGVALLDWYTPRLDLALLYLVPVALAAWRLGALHGVLWAMVATLTGSMVEAFNTGVAGGWNAVIRLGAFAFVAVTVAALRRARAVVRTLAGTDHLTGVQNARSFGEVVGLERSRALRYNRPFTLAYLDVDGLRVVNREWGHAKGDQALRLIAATIRENLRGMDSVSRLGGDEFALLLPETGQAAAEAALRKLQSRLVDAIGRRSLALTFTVGAVVCVGAPESVEELIQRAEAVMYSAKQEGGAGLRTEVLDENFGIEAILQRG